jgi:hypothetical protein
MIRRISLSLITLLAVAVAQAFNPTAITIIPSTFDFGWCPDNSKIDAEFTIRNTGTDLIPITDVQPTCGCTVPNFKAGSLGTNDESKVVLTFNTRGYAGSVFHKNAKIKTDANTADYTVNMVGRVLDASATVAPDGDGVAEFTKDTKEKKKTISIHNKGAAAVTLKVVQPAAGWANAKLEAESLKPGETASIVVAPDGGFDVDRTTSMTVEANDGTAASRFTIAIRTGTPPPVMRQPAARPVAPTPSAAPAKPVKK